MGEIRTLTLAAVLIGGAVSAGAQCLGDFDADGSVEITELITAISNSLNGCTMRLTPTRRPIPTPTVPAGPRCSWTFSDDPASFCVFDGPFNTAQCPGDTTAISFNGDRSIVVFVLLNTNPRGGIAGDVVSSTRVDLWGYSLDGFDTAEPLDGVARLEQNGARLVIEPAEPPFTINGCGFRRYDGSYEMTIGESALRAGEGNMSGVLERAQQWRLRLTPTPVAVSPRPNFSRTR